MHFLVEKVLTSSRRSEWMNERPVDTDEMWSVFLFVCWFVSSSLRFSLQPLTDTVQDVDECSSASTQQNVFCSLYQRSRWRGTNTPKCWKPTNCFEGNRYSAGSKLLLPSHSPSFLLCNYLIDWSVLIAGLIIAALSQLALQQLRSEVKCEEKHDQEFRQRGNRGLEVIVVYL